jgi:competence protein ComEA
VVNPLAPRSQWLAIILLAAVIFAVLLGRSYKRHPPLSPIYPPPVIVAVEGAVKEAGTRLLPGPEVSIGRAIESAGGLHNCSSNKVPEDIAMKGIGNGRIVQVECSGRGPLEIRVEAMPAAARLTLGEKLHLNAASGEDLMFVPQMKSGVAEAIVNHRRSRPWRSLEELEEIPGVGPRTIERWRNYLMAGEPESDS